MIDLLLHEGGVRELTGEITVIRNEDDARSIAVKSRQDRYALRKRP